VGVDDAAQLILIFQLTGLHLKNTIKHKLNSQKEKKLILNHKYLNG